MGWRYSGFDSVAPTFSDRLTFPVDQPMSVPCTPALLPWRPPSTPSLPGRAWPSRDPPRPSRPSVCDDSEMRSRIQAVVLPSEPDRVSRRGAPDVPGTRPRYRRGGAHRRVRARRSTSSKPTRPSKSASICPACLRRRSGSSPNGQTLLIAGNKAPRRTRPDASFHLVERGYGRFARVVPLVGVVRHEPRPRHR